MSCGFSLTNVEKGYGGISVLTGVTACFESGRTHVLMGPSGSGKTTLLRLLAGLETPDAGEVGRSGVERLAMTFQEDRLCDNLTVTANVRLDANKLVTPSAYVRLYDASGEEIPAAVAATATTAISCPPLVLMVVLPLIVMLPPLVDQIP